jgi:Cu+-exporting ATPase
MAVAEVAVMLGGALLIAALGSSPAGRRRAAPSCGGDVQEIEIAGKGGYPPDLVRVTEGVPMRLAFNRQKNSECTSRVAFPEFRVSKSLAAFGKAVVEFVPDRGGEFGFACGMSMIHGWVIVEAVGEAPRAAATGLPATEGASGSGAHAHDGHEHQVATAAGVGPTREVDGTSQVEFALLGGGVNWPTCVRVIEQRLDANRLRRFRTASEVTS